MHDNADSMFENAWDSTTSLRFVVTDLAVGQERYLASASHTNQEASLHSNCLILLMDSFEQTNCRQNSRQPSSLATYVNCTHQKWGWLLFSAWILMTGYNGSDFKVYLSDLELSITLLIGQYLSFTLAPVSSVLQNSTKFRDRRLQS